MASLLDYRIFKKLEKERETNARKALNELYKKVRDSANSNKSIKLTSRDAFGIMNALVWLGEKLDDTNKELAIAKHTIQAIKEPACNYI